MNRDQFEKLEEIKFRLGLVYFSESLNIYLSKVYGCDVDIGYINGAWFAWQEQQKKADKALYAIAQSELHGDRAIWGLRDEIKELLK